MSHTEDVDMPINRSIIVSDQNNINMAAEIEENEVNDGDHHLMEANDDDDELFDQTGPIPSSADIVRRKSANDSTATAASIRRDSTAEVYYGTGVAKSAGDKRMPNFLEACQHCDDVTIRYFLNNEITSDQLNQQDNTGKTGMSHACGNGFVDIVNLNGSSQVDVNLPDNEGNTPLIIAAQAGHSQIVNLLIQRFPELQIDQRNKQGFTALLKAAIQGRSKCCRLLLASGASAYRRDYGRRLCALEWAKYCGRTQCAQTVLNFMQTSEMPPKDDAYDRRSKMKLRRKSDGNLVIRTPDRSGLPSLVRVFQRLRGSLPTINFTRGGSGSGSVRLIHRHQSSSLDYGQSSSPSSTPPPTHKYSCHQSAHKPFRTLEQMGYVLSSTPQSAAASPLSKELLGGSPILGRPPPPNSPQIYNNSRGMSSRKQQCCGNANETSLLRHAVLKASVSSNAAPYNIVPKVQVTFASKDDNYFTETGGFGGVGGGGGVYEINFDDGIINQEAVNEAFRRDHQQGKKPLQSTIGLIRSKISKKSTA